ncbi:hypothetical protein A2331_03425 [Candidatus Falkowbacteria bacterium RIFOXYB2_FULL_34_18]|uniref:Uncharacterized protein n=1 Tax=Candidatus Falkowbacteria bacterium RIFOXYD2_FULL_34_120 TaxID=1798007 RepID=A0A1F5TS53_9BACT|nr:MAG: hypothetical protein A2331_03425 [Candidatus Falkowbacteria bacterium RIFOXYB2_FULL_34_18]OGF30127.1 MAG: hypothetical protein A2500_05025 [Candidatus Falkowbacteria bacterium RIFOXYC12_FULL_34_55]OGF37539.1 MAG: hypothetical protein A2466_01820 [Candidatus Falkowbacteria bacterium RIFOXYC2_FULL_34_220]OGF39295.1 MAG: hypothetical protein A2515_02235 [Candidatus Falkowbacteria bacterium RIFOXYD12_FULL_34_57]OGF41800.1 MAG: hypothetical protein A2531_05220 [Candidatus Falkowbacteria bact
MQALKQQIFVFSGFFAILKDSINELMFLAKTKVLEIFDDVCDCHIKQQLNEICFYNQDIRRSNSRCFFVYQKNCELVASAHIRCVALQYTPIVVFSNKTI